MESFKNILLVVSEKADNSALVARAIARAKRNGATLTIVDVVREPISSPLYTANIAFMPGLLEAMPQCDLSFGDGSERLAEMHESIIEERRVELTKIVQQAEKEGVDASADVLCGVPFVEIIREVIRNKRDLVMTAAGGRRNLSQMIFGRTSMQLMRKCPCPVWAFKSSQHQPHESILAAIDPMPYDGRSDARNRKILDLAVSLAELDSADLHVVHAWAWLRELSETRTLAMEPIDDRMMTKALRRTGRECIDRLLEKYEVRNARITIHTLDGCPEEVIPDFARTEDVDLIVMGTVCRTGLDGFFMGSTAETVLRNANCSVLTIKPDGFVSPMGAGE